MKCILRNVIVTVVIFIIIVINLYYLCNQAYDCKFTFLSDYMSCVTQSASWYVQPIKL